MTLMQKKKLSILVVANDAGGAEIIAAYLKKHKAEFDSRSYVSGPAVGVFTRLKLPHQIISQSKKDITSIIKNHEDVDFALFGTGWMTRIEYDALQIAKARGLKTAVYLESWVNYRERFGYPAPDWDKNLPHEIWVGDKYALLLARRSFPSLMVRLIPNEYFANIVKKYHLRATKTPPSPSCVLFLSDAVPGIEKLLEQLLQYLEKKKLREVLRIRFHPADDHTRYDALIAKYRGRVKVEKSKNKDIICDFLLAKAVVGSETVAMVPAILVGKRVVNIVPVGRSSLLPFHELKRVKQLTSSVRII